MMSVFARSEHHLSIPLMIAVSEMSFYPPKQSATPVPHDVVCAKCGYSLKGLTSDSICPECGSSIEESISLKRLRDRKTEWLGNRRQLIARRWANLALMLLLLLGGILLLLSNPAPDNSRVFTPGSSKLAGAAMIAGCLYLVILKIRNR